MDLPFVVGGADLLRLTLLCRKVDKELALSAGFSVDELHCLGVLYLERPSCVKKLSQFLGLSATRTSKILRSLEQKGYVARALQLTDRRKEQVTLTREGMEAAENVLSISSEVGKKVCSSIPAEIVPYLSRLVQMSD
ncbi:MAG: transcriptional regulator [Bacteroidota bacterium]